MIYANVEVIMKTEQNNKGKLYYRVYAQNKSSKSLMQGSNYITRSHLLAYHHFKKLLKQNKARF